MISLFAKSPEPDGFDSLERKMVRTLALHREMKKILEAEYEAGKNYKPRALARLTLRKRNCMNRFGHMVASIRDQLRRMAGKDLPRTCPRTLPNRIRAIPGLPREREETLVPLARALEAENLALIEAARENVNLFRGVLRRVRAVSRYTRQGGTA